MNVEHRTFTTLVSSLTRGKDPEASMFHKQIAQNFFAKTVENAFYKM